MWPFDSEPTKEKLQGHKDIVINGFRFTIKKIEPLVDFPNGKIPQIFSSFITRRRPEEQSSVPEDKARRAQEDIASVLRAGLVKPTVNEKGELDSGANLDDLFRYKNTAYELYFSILSHSLNEFRGLRGVFFYQKTLQSLLTQWRKDTVLHRQELLTEQVGSV